MIKISSVSIGSINRALYALWCRLCNIDTRVTDLEEGGGSGIQSITAGDNTNVDNTDPLNPIIEANLIIQATRAEVLTAITNSTLSTGALYQIDGVDVPLYGGTTIYLKATAPNVLSKEGDGLFYNPKYNSGLADDGIWHNISTFVASSIVGTFTANENITANNGATGKLFTTIGANKFIVLTGDWTTATSITGATSAATANIGTIVLKSYTAGSSTIYGGKHWTNVNGNLGTNTTSLTLNTEWSVVPYDSTNYNVSVDPITYDIANDIIVKRSDLNGNEVEATLDNRLYFTSLGYTGNPINVFQWGNRYNYSILRGTSENKILGGYAESVNNIGAFFSNKVSSKSSIQGNISYLSKINMNKLEDYSQLRANTLNSGVISDNVLQTGISVSPVIPVTINSNVLSSSDIKGNTILVRSTINSNVLTSSFIYTNFVRITSNINSNIMTGSAQIFFNDLKQSSTINSNVMTSGSIRDNWLDYASTINSNITSTGAFIYLNKIEQSNINSNTLNAFGYITRNVLIGFARLNSNTITGSSSSNPSSISSNFITAGEIESNTINGPVRADITTNKIEGPYGYTDAAGRSSIKGCSLTASNTKIELNTLQAATKIDNVTISTANLSFSNNEFFLNPVNLSSVALVRNYAGNKVNATEASYTHSVTFTGAAGLGAIGSVTLPSFPVPTGFFITNVLVNTGAGLTGSGAVLNLGVATDGIQSGLDDTTGAISTLNAAVTSNVVKTTFVKTTATRNITLEVKTAAITAGTLQFTVNLSKIL